MKKIGFFIFSLIFFIVGLIILLLGIYLENNRQEFIANNPYTVGTLDIEHKADESNAYANYIVNGVTYRNRLSFYSSSMNSGDEVIVYYNATNPNEIEVADASMKWFMSIFGGVFMTIGIIPIIYMIMKSSRNNRLLKNGIRVEGEFLRVEQINKIEINGQYPSVIICNISYNGRNIEAKSSYILFDSAYIKSQIESQGIRNFPVYLNSKNIERNFIDISNLKL